MFGSRCVIVVTCNVCLEIIVFLSFHCRRFCHRLMTPRPQEAGSWCRAGHLQSTCWLIFGSYNPHVSCFPWYSVFLSEIFLILQNYFIEILLLISVCMIVTRFFSCWLFCNSTLLRSDTCAPYCCHGCAFLACDWLI